MVFTADCLLPSTPVPNRKLIKKTCNNYAIRLLQKGLNATVYMDICLPSSNSAAPPCLRGSHGQTLEKPVCMIYVSEYLPGGFKSSQLPPERNIDHVSTLLPTSDSTARFLLCQPLLQAAALCGRCSELLHFFSLSLSQRTPVQSIDFEFVSTLRSTDGKKSGRSNAETSCPCAKTGNSAKCFDSSDKTRRAVSPKVSADSFRKS